VDKTIGIDKHGGRNHYDALI